MEATANTADELRKYILEYRKAYQVLCKNVEEMGKCVANNEKEKAEEIKKSVSNQYSTLMSTLDSIEKGCMVLDGVLKKEQDSLGYTTTAKL
ncbi:hypothetical protein WA556_000986 [Blastocystis sp. ATCC 50177/Nand II]